MKYFNSTNVAKFIINKTLEIKDKKIFMGKVKKKVALNFWYNRSRWIIFS